MRSALFVLLICTSVTLLSVGIKNKACSSFPGFTYIDDKARGNDSNACTWVHLFWRFIL
jgi:hypothetical protein